MLKKRIIPCLDINNGRVVKGINFINLVDAGDPAEQAKIYNDGGELISILVVKGKASNKLSKESLIHGVDGISGATITSKGVTDLLKRDLNRYKIFFDKHRKN